MYATLQDMIDRYGLDELLLAADRDHDGAVDADVVERALADATAEIDAYLAQRYQLPLPKVPAVLTRLAVDIAIYRLKPDAARATEEGRARYKDAVALLERIASGEVSLGLEVGPPSANGGVTLLSDPRRFGRGRRRVF